MSRTGTTVGRRVLLGASILALVVLLSGVMGTLSGVATAVGRQAAPRSPSHAWGEGTPIHVRSSGRLRRVDAPTYAAPVASGSVYGLVTNASSAPLAAVAIEALDPNTGSGVASTVTAGDGSYTLDLPDGTYNVLVTPPTGSGYTSQTIKGVAVNGATEENITLVAANVSTLSGKVTDSNGNDLVGMTVGLIDQNGNPTIYSTTTAANGDYSLAVPDGTTDYLELQGVVVAASGYAAFNFSVETSTELTVNSDRTDDFVIPPIVGVQLTVDESSGIPAPAAGVGFGGGASAVTLSSGQVVNISGSDASATNTNQDGVIDLSAIALPSADAAYGVYLTPPPGDLTDIVTQPPLFPVSASESLTVSLNAGTLISGQVTDSNGVELSGVGLRFGSNGGKTSSNGDYSFPVTPGSTNYIGLGGSASAASGYNPTQFSMGTESTFTVTSGLIENFTVPVAGVLVTVLRPDGTPASGASVTLAFTASGELLTLPSGQVVGLGYAASTGTTDANGVVDLTAVPIPGAVYELDIVPPPGDATDVETLVNGLTVAGPAASFTESLQAGVPISGQVTDSNGNELSGVSVLFGSNTTISTTTSSNGDYSVLVPPNASYSVELAGGDAAASGFLPDQFRIFVNSGLAVGASAVTDDFRIPVARVHLTVDDAAGDPVPGVTAELHGLYGNALTLPSGQDVIVEAGGLSGTTDSNGVVEFSAVPLSGPQFSVLLTPPVGDTQYITTNITNVTISGDTVTTYILTKATTATATTTAVVDDSGTAVTGDTFHDTATVTVNGASVASVATRGERARQLVGDQEAGPVSPSGTLTYYFFGDGVTCSSDNIQKATADPVTLKSDGSVPNSSSVGPLGAGSYNFLAVYGGDANYSSSTSSCEPFGVDKDGTTTATKVVDEKGIGVTGDSYHDTATVTPVSQTGPGSRRAAAIEPGGTLTYTLYSGGCGAASGLRPRTIIGQPDTVNLTNGAAPPSLTSGPLAAGSYYYLAVYNGDSNYASSSDFCEAFTVSPAPLTITASSDAIAYGGPVPSIKPIYQGFIPGFGQSTLTQPPTCTTTATSYSSVATYPTTCGGASDPDYTIKYVGGRLKVGSATLVVTASTASKLYAAAVPTITASYSGFVNGDTPRSLKKKPTCTTDARSSSRVGSYPASCSGAEDPNYSFSYRKGTLRVLPAHLVITAATTFMVAGQPVPEIAPLYAGLVNRDTIKSLTTKPMCTTTALSSSVPGNYLTRCFGAQDPNYTIAYVNGVLTVVENPGYRTEGGDGGVFAFHKSFVGSVPPPSLGLHVFDFVGMAATTNGYWMVERDGGVFSFGTAGFFGSLPSKHIHVDDIVGIAARPDGGGYWLVSSTGTVYAFGDAVWHGDASSLGLKDVVAIASSDAGGYLLVTSTGVVHTYGDETSWGDCARSVAPCGSVPDIVGVALNGSGGYWLVGRDGGVFAFGNAHYFGSCPQTGSQCHGVGDVVGIASPDAHGYWLAEADGNILAFGDAKFYGRCGIAGTYCASLARPIVAIAS